MSSKSNFEQASQQQRPSLIQDLWLLVSQNKKWWLLPLVAVLGLLGLLAVLGSTGAAPFIYTLF